jgi:hypothetical protein
VSDDTTVPRAGFRAESRSAERGVHVRPVAFVKYYEKASTILRADQMAEALRSEGVDAVSIRATELASVRDRVLVFVKTSRLDHLLCAKLRGNLLVLDVHDTLVFKRRIKNRRLFDGILFTHLRQLEDFGDARRLCRVIPIHADPRFRRHTAGWQRLEVAYLGDRRSFAQFGEIPGVACFDSDYFDVAPRYNCHVAVRAPGRESDYKPAIKVATAAACGALLITTRDCATRELLGDDYPYYTDANAAALLATIERARADLGGPRWRAALDRLSQVEGVLTRDHCARQYLRFLGELESARFAARA